MLKLSNTENRLSDQVLTWRTERDRYGTEPWVRVPRVREPKVRVPRIHQLRWQVLKPQSPETKKRKPPSPKPQAASRKPQVLGPWVRANGLGQWVRVHGTTSRKPWSTKSSHQVLRQGSEHLKPPSLSTMGDKSTKQNQLINYSISIRRHCPRPSLSTRPCPSPENSKIT